MELESKLKDALGEPARSDQLLVCCGQDVRSCEDRRAVGRIDGRRLIYAGDVDDVEEVGELAYDLNAHRLADRNEARVTQIDLLDGATRRCMAPQP